MDADQVVHRNLHRLRGDHESDFPGSQRNVGLYSPRQKRREVEPHISFLYQLRP